MARDYDNMMDYDQIMKRLEGMVEWNDFASSLVGQHSRRGKLSERQWDAAERMIRKVDATRARKAETQRAVDVSAVERLFDTARGNGLKRPTFRADGITLSLAGPNSRNAGAIYVKQGETYMGKVMNSTFMPSRDASPVIAEKLAEIVRDPLASAVKYGRDTGICACCGRLLTDPASVELGIGPVCKTRWGL